MNLALQLLLSLGGAEEAPKHLLRLQRQPNTERVYRVEQSAQFGSRSGITLSMRLREVVHEVEEQRARLERRLERIELVDPGPGNDLVKALVGISWRGWVDHRGRWERLALSPTEDKPKLLQPLLEELQFLPAGGHLLLPEAPIGIGSSWQLPASMLLKPTRQDAQPTTGQIECTLISLQSQIATIQLKLAAELGTEQDQRTGSATGEGQLVVDLASGFLQRFQFESTMKLNVRVGGRTETHLLRSRFQLIGETR